MRLCPLKISCRSRRESVHVPSPGVLQGRERACSWYFSAGSCYTLRVQEFERPHQEPPPRKPLTVKEAPSPWLITAKMACATLKRANSWDPLSPNGKPAKRRRFFAPASVAAPPAPRHTAPTRPHQARSSPFVNATPRVTSDEIEANVRDEMSRLQRRRQLFVQQGPPDDSPAVLCTLPPQGARPDQPVFTFRQVGLIVERMVSERERQLCEIYDDVLSAKLAEQYDAFVKFTHDQVQRRFEEVTPSYLS